MTISQLPAKCHNISVFCGAQSGFEQSNQDLAAECGRIMGQHGLHLIYGGGNTGLMGILSRSTQANGGKVTGILPKTISLIEPLQEGLDQTLLVESLSARKDMMVEMSDAFLALPGGFGTLDELFEVITLKGLGIIDLPVVIVNHRGYWDRLIPLFQNMTDQGFVSNKDLVIFADDLTEAFEHLGYR